MHTITGVSEEARQGDVAAQVNQCAVDHSQVIRRELFP